MPVKIFNGISLTREESIRIEKEIEQVELKKGQYLLKANQVTLNQYYVSSGCLRTYYIDKSGKEHTVQFAITDWWISDYTAFFNSGKAIMNIECIQDAVLYKMPRESMEKLYIEIPKLESFVRKKLESAFTSFQKRILASLALSATERYLSFIRTYPNIEQSVKNYHIASYLGTTTESLSRIRKELALK